MTERLIEKCNKIKLLVTDVDGVLTDGKIIYNDSHIEIKEFNVKDGYICKHLIKAGIKLGIITGRKSAAVSRRAGELGFAHVFQGVDDKLETLKKMLALENLEPEEIAYIGDDLNDLGIFNFVGLSAAPFDAFDYIASKADYICNRKGGDAAFREFADLILKHRNEQNT